MLGSRQLFSLLLLCSYRLSPSPGSHHPLVFPLIPLLGLFCMPGLVEGETEQGVLGFGHHIPEQNKMRDSCCLFCVGDLSG